MQSEYLYHLLVEPVQARVARVWQYMMLIALSLIEVNQHAVIKLSFD